MTARIPIFLVLATLMPAAVLATPGERMAGICWQDPVDVATGRGEKGAWQQNESRYDYVDDPAIALHASGAAAVVWVEQKSKDVYFQQIAADGARQGQPVNISRSPATFSWLPRLVIASHDPKKIHVLWQEIIFSGGSHGGDILFAYSEDGGASFSTPRNLSASIGGDGKGRLTRDIWSNGSLDLALDGKGILYAAWTEYDGMLWLARSGDGGKRFSPPRRIAGDKQVPARAPALATGVGGTVYLAWTVGEDPHAAIRVARSDDGGNTFGAPQLVGAGQGHADAPRLALDGAGALHLVYAQSPDGPSGRYAIRHALSRDGGKSFGLPQTISAPLPGGAGAGYPGLAVDAHGRLLVLWETYPQPKAPSRGLAFAASRDGGKTFSEPAMVPGSRDPGGGINGSQQGLLMKKLAMNGDGAIAVVNSSLQSGTRSRVWLVRGTLTEK